MAIIGYARVSSVDQSLAVQVDKLKAYACNKIYQEKYSGITADRPELKACLDYVREDDVLVITKLDRLARSTFHLTQFTGQFLTGFLASAHPANLLLLFVPNALPPHTRLFRLFARFLKLGVEAQ